VCPSYLDYTIFPSSAYRNRDAKLRFPQEIAVLAKAMTQAFEMKMLYVVVTTQSLYWSLVNSCYYWMHIDFRATLLCSNSSLSMQGKGIHK